MSEERIQQFLQERRELEAYRCRLEEAYSALQNRLSSGPTHELKARNPKTATIEVDGEELTLESIRVRVAAAQARIRKIHENDIPRVRAGRDPETGERIEEA